MRKLCASLRYEGSNVMQNFESGQFLSLKCILCKLRTVSEMWNLAQAKLTC